MIFDQPQKPIGQQDRSVQRLCSLTKLIANFEASFASVRYRILESISIVNAQASFANGKHLVDIFGGLAFHPVIRHDALVFTLLHETGHHLSTGCRLPSTQLACECAADRWAITEGRKVIAANGENFRLEAALRQIEQAIGPAGREIPSKASRPTNCWSMNWQKRKRALLDGRTTVLKTCQISSAIRR
jgi:hypothetical protein